MFYAIVIYLAILILPNRPMEIFFHIWITYKKYNTITPTIDVAAPIIKAENQKQK
jgi:hypothetical protein